MGVVLCVSLIKRQRVCEHTCIDTLYMYIILDTLYMYTEGNAKCSFHYACVHVYVVFEFFLGTIGNCY